jgi:hypothetical protein
MEHHRTPSLVTFLTIALVLTPTLAGMLMRGSASMAQETPSLRIDAITSGNQPASIGTLDECRSVDVGDTFEVDLVIEDVTDLIVFQASIGFDSTLLEIKDRNVDSMFLAANDDSNVIDTSNRLPSPPPYGVSGVEIGDPGAADSGSGVLARLTFEALKAGTATVEYTRSDFDSDGELDLGPYLKDAKADVIGDDDGDSYFDGEATGAVIEIGGECPDVVDVPGKKEGSSGANWLVIVLAAVGALVAGAVTVILLISRKGAKSD